MSVIHSTSRVFLLLSIISCLAQIRPARAQTLLVDFGSSAAGNRFGLSGWNTLLLAGDMTYSSAGPGGVTLETNLDVFSDYMGVSGTARQFSKGERIVATWYNNSDEVISFTSRVSFTDNNNPSAGSPDGNWYTMRSFNDYRYTYQYIQPHDSAKTVFNITDTGVHKTDSVYSLVNINLCIEWFDSQMKQYLICDRIELLNDADTTAPCPPEGLTVQHASSFEVQLTWIYPCNDTDPVEYIIYSGDEIEGYSRELGFTAYNLNQSTEYSFSVSAVDKAGNESARSSPVTASTPAFTATAGLMNPSGFQYMGAILLPEVFAYGADGLAYNPNGEGGQSGAGAADGYPGSFFVTDINQPDRGFVGEVSIPAPVISAAKNPEDLNQCTVLQAPVNIRPANVSAWEYVDVWITGLEYIEEENRLYSSWAIYYDVTGDKTASLSCVRADSLNSGVRYGAWFVGSSSASVIPRDSYLNDYLFRAPQSWADGNTFGRALINGRYREGGLSGLGPTLYATSLIGSGTPPAANSETEITPLLQYGPVEASDNYNFPNSLHDYNHADWLKGADWISVDSEAAVAIIGNKGLGHNYYGYVGERMRHEWVVVDEPYPEYAETDPDGKGWKAYNSVPVILLYDPADLAGVVTGSLQPYDPQPYAALRLEKSLFYGASAQISSAAYDKQNNLLYVAEFVPEAFGNVVLHVWKVNYVPTGIRTSGGRPNEFRLEQNYPNPFNAGTVIGYSVPSPTGRDLVSNQVRDGQLSAVSHVTLKVFDILGREIETLVEEKQNPGYHRVTFEAGHLASGIYIYRIQVVGNDGKYVTSAKKLVLMK